MDATPDWNGAMFTSYENRRYYCGLPEAMDI